MKYDLYDFDGTIYDGDSGVDIVKFAIKKYPRFIWYLLGSLGTVILFLLGLRTKEEMKNKIFRFVPEIENLDAFVKEFWEKHERKLKKFWLDKKDHSKDIIISASCRFWLEPIAKKYKVHDLFATDIDLKIGKIIGKNCHGKEKVKYFYDRYPKAIIEEMYTDSVHDLPLIEEAKKGYLVKKDKIYNYYEYKPNFIVRFWRWGWGIYHKNEELWNYLIVGGLTTVVSLVSKWLLWLVLDPKDKMLLQISIILSWVITVLFAYIANRLFVFKSKNKNIIKEMSSFFGARLLTLGMEMLIMWFFVSYLKLNEYVFTIIAQVLILVANYIFSKIFVFKKEK